MYYLYYVVFEIYYMYYFLNEIFFHNRQFSKIFLLEVFWCKVIIIILIVVFRGEVPRPHGAYLFCWGWGPAPERNFYHFHIVFVYFL